MIKHEHRTEQIVGEAAKLPSAKPLVPINRYLVRPRAWWFNKIPLSITLMLLLIDGDQFNLATVFPMILVVLTICAIGNYGYALNDLYDIEEDARVQRTNAVTLLGQRRTGVVVIASAFIAILFATLAAGWRGSALTVFEVALPAAYSIPPLRIKERKWLGVAADGLAAHVYPAVIGLLAVSEFNLRPITKILTICLLAWSFAIGIRGILSHQLHTADRDHHAGLVTVVHDFGSLTLEVFIMIVLVPIELIGFIGIIAACQFGPALEGLGSIYLAYELFKTIAGGFRVTAFRPQGQPYLPFVEESFYKGWGPIIIALDAMRIDLAFGIFIPFYALMFKPHMRAECGRLLSILHKIRQLYT